jgi:hypothetical protein
MKICTFILIVIIIDNYGEKVKHFYFCADEYIIFRQRCQINAPGNFILSYLLKNSLAKKPSPSKKKQN